uniref:Conotoxin sr7a n=1 Tax=Conus spurius TaxID=192919 RepID=U6A_CONSP|nr:RecName: Full=Conotoxin sr7a [Conus spurius]
CLQFGSTCFLGDDDICCSGECFYSGGTFGICS